MAWGVLEAGPVRGGAGDAALTGIDGLQWGTGPSGPVLYASSGPGGALSAWTPDAAGALQPLDRASLPNGAVAGVDGEVVLVGGATPWAAATGVRGAPLWGMGIDGTGGFGSKVAVSGAALPPDLHDAVSVDLGGTTYLYGLRLGADQPSVWRVGADGALTTVSDPAPARPPASGEGLASLAPVTVGGTTFLLGALAPGDALVCWRAGPTGALAETDRLAAGEGGIGFDSPSAVTGATLGSRGFAVMAASGTGTLTVAEVKADGTLAVTDQVMDDLGTRFAGAGLLDSVTVDGRSFVVAAGSDDGVTLFELLPGGRLLLLSTLADGTATTLAGPSSLAVTAEDGVLRIAVASPAEPGITLLEAGLPQGGSLRDGGSGADTLLGTGGDDRIDGAAGADSLSGGTGDDVLMDGAGADRMAGGDGADIFVLAADGEADTITGFDPGEDRLDLTGWPSLRTTGQLIVATTSTGAEIRYGAETLVLVAADGQPLPVSEVLGLDLLGLTRTLTWTTPPAGPRTLTGGAGADTLWGGAAADRLSGSAGDDSLDGQSGNDLLYGGDGADRLGGADGDDQGWGGAGDDQGWGGNGNDSAWGEDGDDRAWGGTGNDSLYGGLGIDSLWGEAGLDRLDGGDGNDAAWGGDGNDSLTGGAGVDTLSGEAGNDSLAGGPGADSLWGGPGADWLGGDEDADRLDGGDGDDTGRGGAGNDSLTGGLGIDSLFGEDGADSLSGGDGADRAWGGAGEDRLAGDAGDDSLWGDTEDDKLWGVEGNDWIDGGQGADSAWGGAGGDTLYGGDGGDWLAGEDGDDRLNGAAGSDSLFGAAGNDRLTDDDGNDRLEGGDGADRLKPGAGNDTLFGGAGNDVLKGGLGNDRLAGDGNDDRLIGGGGDDSFVFSAGSDTVTDFQNNRDTILLDDALWGGGSRTAAQMLAWAKVAGGDVVFTFPSGATLTVQGVTDTALLSDDLGWT